MLTIFKLFLSPRFYSHAFILKLKPDLQGTVFCHSSFIPDESLGTPGISFKTEVLAKRKQIKRS